jgi:hypothetical protein
MEMAMKETLGILRHSLFSIAPIFYALWFISPHLNEKMKWSTEIPEPPPIF